MGAESYVLLERIGVGGMAEVFRASAHGAEGFERPIAIKRILPSLSEDDDFIRMFVDEAKIAVQLQHPNIVQIFDLGRDGREYFIAMELVHGKDLRAIQDRCAQAGEPVPLAAAVHIGMKMCEALHHAHFASSPGGQPLNVVHRDVTPQNVLVSFDGEVKVTDFGLAKAAGRATQTQSGVIKGKLAYMAPEAFRGLAVDHRSDVYGVGILLWEMLTGQRLFLGKTDVDTVTKAQAAVVPRPRSIDPRIPDEVERIVLRSLARDRDQRHQTAEELHDDLEAFAYGHQRFISTATLAQWLRGLFPVEPQPDARRRAPDIVTREIRLSDVGRSRSGVRADSVPPEDLDLVEEDDSALEDAEEPAEAQGDAVEEVDESSFTTDQGVEDDERTVYEPLEQASGEARDTVQPPPGAPEDPFDESTNRLAPVPSEPRVPTEQRYDQELLQTTVPRAPAVPKAQVPPLLQGAGWDDDDEATAIVHSRKPSR